MIIFLAVILVAALFFTAVMIIDNHRFVVRRYAVRSGAIRSSMKIVFIADLHEKDYGDGNEELAREIAAQEPDMILVGGDLIVSGKVWSHSRKSGKLSGSDAGTELGAAWMKNSIALMKKLSRICPVWFVRGNHEIRLAYFEELREYDALFKAQMEDAGVTYIENRCVDLVADSRGCADSGILLQGLELPMEYYEKFKKTGLSVEDLERLIGRPDPSSFTMLLTHSPVYFETYVKWGADLCLCGHVHGGLMRLPLIGGVMGTRPNLFPKYSGGRYSYSIGETDGNRTGTMVLTCGLGTHTLPIRIFNPGEISVIELQAEESA